MRGKWKKIMLLERGLKYGTSGSKTFISNKILKSREILCYFSNPAHFPRRKNKSLFLPCNLSIYIAYTHFFKKSKTTVIRPSTILTCKIFEIYSTLKYNKFMFMSLKRLVKCYQEYNFSWSVNWCVLYI